MNQNNTNKVDLRPTDMLVDGQIISREEFLYNQNPQKYLEDIKNFCEDLDNIWKSIFNVSE